MLGSAAAIQWLSVNDVVQLNIKVVTKTAEDHAILSQSALEGAVARPQNLHAYEDCVDIVVLGVRLIAGLAKDHCFIQGNKRTAFHAGIVFMELNGVFLDLKDTEANAKLVVDYVTDSIGETVIVEALQARQI